MKKRHALRLLLAWFVFWLSPCALAEEQLPAFSGHVYPHFQIVRNEQVQCTAYENYGNMFLSKNVLYSISLNDMTAARILSVRNAYSKIFAESDSVYFTYPDSWISSHLLYGAHTWYLSSINDVQKKNWHTLYKNTRDATQETEYFQTVGGVYCIVDSGDRYGYCELKKYENGHYTSCLTVEHADLVHGHSFVIIDRADRKESQILQVYDILGDRTFNVPYADGWLPDIVIVDNKLYYNTKNRVFCYHINTGLASEVFTSSPDKSLSLCYDSGNLFIIESFDERKAIHVFSVEDNQLTRSVSIPEEFCRYGDYIIANEIMLTGMSSSEEVVSYDLGTYEGRIITLP